MFKTLSAKFVKYKFFNYNKNALTGSFLTEWTDIIHRYVFVPFSACVLILSVLFLHRTTDISLSQL